MMNEDLIRLKFHIANMCISSSSAVSTIMSLKRMVDLHATSWVINVDCILQSEITWMTVTVIPIMNLLGKT